MSEMTLTLSSPITEEQFDAITDVDFDNTDRIWFHTKHGKDVEFIKRKRGKWIGKYPVTSACSECNYLIHDSKVKAFAFCPNCGADMRGEQDE